METKFQTSFIPKRPIISTESTLRVHHSVSIFMMVGVLFFIASLAGAGFVVFYKSSLESTQKSYKESLAKNINDFQPDLIDHLHRANVKIDDAKSLLASHAAVSQVFGIIGALTAENIKFKSLDYTAPTVGTAGKSSSGLAQVSMQGIGTSFSAIAFQSDVFGKSINYGRNIIVKSPVLSNLSLDANGNVAFTFTAGLDPADYSYTKILKQSLGTTDATAGDAATGNTNQ
ncbi:MAG: hypothetical protein WCQ60_00985 [bacterium]